MSRNDFVPLLTRRPFQPFRIVTSDGTNYEIHHPEMVMPVTTSAVIGYPDPELPRTFLRYDVVAMQHIVRLEPTATEVGIQGNGNQAP